MGFICIYKPANTLVWSGGGGGEKGGTPNKGLYEEAPFKIKGTFHLGYGYIKGIDDHIMD